MYKYNFNSMSTTVQILVEKELFANDLMPVYKLFAKIEDTCSRFKEDSELSQLNSQVGKEVGVSDDMYEILKEALAFYEKTNGIFNPGILAAIEKSGYNKSIEMIRGLDVGASPQAGTASAAMQPYRLNQAERTVVLHARIDLGGIAKSWAVDRAAEILDKYGYGFVNVGGDIRIFGELPQPLSVGIEDPENSSKILSSLQVREGGVATSASKKRSWKMNGENKHHLIDPATGKPSASSIISSTVTAPTAVEADILAKVVLLLGEEKGKALIARKGARAVLINQEKEIWAGGE